MLPSENQAKVSKKRFYLSVDLEDFTYDTHRNLGLNPEINFQALDKCYEVISKFLNENVSFKQWIGVILGFVGATIVLGFDIGLLFLQLGLLRLLILNC